MTATVAPTTLVTRQPDLKNVSLRSTAAAGPLIAMLKDRQTLVYTLNCRLYTSTDYGVTFNGGHFFDDATWTIRGFMELPSGEVLVGVYKSTGTGKVYRSTGWNPATADATSWTQVHTLSGPGCYVRSYWGFNYWGVAPTWSKHAGSIFISEYGPQITNAATPAESAHLVWRSDDDGQTWNVVFNLLDHCLTTQQNHVHGVCYDPWDARLWVVHGDGGGTPSGFGGVWYSDNPEAATPTWTELTEMHAATGRQQVTNIVAVEAGLIMLSDGSPSGAKLLPRRGYRRFGPHIQTTGMRTQASAPFIGASVRRNGGLETPQPDAPIWMCYVEPGGDQGVPVIHVSDDGRSVREAYRHSVAADITLVAGPTIDNKVVAQFVVGGVSYTMTAEYVPPIPKELRPDAEKWARRKRVAESLTSSAALHDDAELKGPLEANSAYEFELVAFYDSPTTADLKSSFTVPAGATITWIGTGAVTSASGSNGSVTYGVATASGGSPGNVGGIGIGTPLSLRCRGVVTTGATAGDLTFQWAQGASDAGATTVYANSLLKAERIP